MSDNSLLIGQKHHQLHGCHAVVVGSGPNGMAAAIVLAEAGYGVELHEAQSTIGGGARTLELTLPGFLHDFGAAIHAMAAGSPFFSSLPLSQHGVEWIHPPLPLAHPLDDGTAVILEHSLSDAAHMLGNDGSRWYRIFKPLAENWSQIAAEVLQPVIHMPRHPFLFARFGISAFASAKLFASTFFKEARTRALFAGIAAHSFLPLAAPLSSSGAIMLAAAAHAVGWPMARGGSQSITNALASILKELGGCIHTNSPVTSLDPFERNTLFLCDISPRQLLAITGHRLNPAFRHSLETFKPGPGTFKVDYALTEPIPWKAADCLRAGTVHLGGTFEEIAASERAIADGQHPERPFVLLTQPTLFDETRAPQGKHIAWAYSHVPNGSTFDMTDRIEAQIERFAPGFRDCVLARHISSPATLESMDANLLGGDISGGAMTLWQTIFRPTRRNYSTSDPNIFLCSASTPGIGGVHGMCGYHAAHAALKHC
ncbi:NAD(P)/FAD-dependent oxidoreductase [Alloacidobacterium dinghuense]|uniref:NAD(P)/FAD-dependent oxidoreductase n=1 Tax=Alloacidobacterium dinghuense TaxID=2763107 RepID=A0A7G8BJG5_9BACT|nr:NAD(P)/FAD-dependent oxidoreductase [Alloacidobacterium dinghuense]QNI32685.1 NAD(P)/FAD-dependent oxidoreductase [Alloacidobacterium dinghuense]